MSRLLSRRPGARPVLGLCRSVERQAVARPVRVVELDHEDAAERWRLAAIVSISSLITLIALIAAR